MKNIENIIQVIFRVIDEFNDQLPKKQQLKKAIDTILFGKSGKLDSLGLVNLIVAVEQAIEEEFGIGITLADERAMSQRVSPFKSVKTLSDYIFLLMEEKINA